MEFIDVVSFEAWVRENFSGGGELNATPSSRRLQEIMAEAVMAPEVTIVSRAASLTGLDEVQARMTMALIYAYLNAERGARDQAI